jgi:hypothetical protein
LIDMDMLTTRDADARFAELICADPELLRNEFSALIAASFGAPPAWPRPPAPPTFPSGDRADRAPGDRLASSGRIRLAAEPGLPQWRGPGRQRSPPL